MKSILFEKHRSSSRIIFMFVICVLIYWVLFAVSIPLYLHYIDHIGDVLSQILLYLGFYFIPFAALLAIVSICARKGSNNDALYKKTPKILLVLLAVLIHFIAIDHTWDTAYDVVTFQPIIAKDAADGAYSFKIRNAGVDMEIGCDKGTYERMIVDEDVEYSFAFRYTTLDKEHGYLREAVDTREFIDNRANASK